MTVKLTPQELSQKYDRFARWYDGIEGSAELLGVSRLRRELLQHASGRVLEVAIGTGKNLPYYPRECRVFAVDLSRQMLNVARTRAARLSVAASLALADAQTLPFPDGSFDTVISSLSTCTFPDPAAALKEMARVCRPEGKILLLEHGRSDRAWLGRFQDRTADRHAKQLGCHWNRATADLVTRAGLKVHKMQRVFFGIFHQIEAAPGRL